MSDNSPVRLDSAPLELSATPEFFESLTPRFVDAMDVSERSRAAYTINIRQFILWLKQNDIKHHDRETILEYKRSLISKDLSAYTVNAYVTTVRLFFEWLETLKLFPNIAKGVRGSKRPHGHQKDSLTKEQIFRLLDSIDRSSLKGLRDFAFINLLVRTGLRTIEVARANIEDIRNISGKTCLFVHGKGRSAKDEPIVLPQSVEIPIREYLTARGPTKLDAPLFAAVVNNEIERLTTHLISKTVKRALRKIGIDSPRITAHSLRHTSISLLIESGASILSAQTLGRHANVSTTMQYVHKASRLVDAPEEKLDQFLERKPKPDS